MKSKYGLGGGGNYTPSLGIGWWRDWERSWEYPPAPGMSKMWTLMHLKEGDPLDLPSLLNKWDFEMTQVDKLIKQGYTRQYWEIGNECDWKPRVAPDIYREVFCHYYQAIKYLDPTASVMCCGLANLIPAWEQWLNDMIIDPDVWSIHPYSSPLSAQATIDEILYFRKVRPSKPIWITEFSTGGYTDYGVDRVADYLRDVCGWLNVNSDRYQIERWFWWGSWADARGMGENGLFRAGPYSQETITPVGAAYLGMRDKAHKYFMPVVVR